MLAFVNNQTINKSTTIRESIKDISGGMVISINNKEMNINIGNEIQIKVRNKPNITNRRSKESK